MCNRVTTLCTRTNTALHTHYTATEREGGKVLETLCGAGSPHTRPPATQRDALFIPNTHFGAHSAFCYYFSLSEFPLMFLSNAFLLTGNMWKRGLARFVPVL